MDKLKVYQKFYQLPEFTRNFMDVKKPSLAREIEYKNARHFTPNFRCIVVFRAAEIKLSAKEDPIQNFN